MTIQDTKPSRKYFNEWAKDKSPFLAMASIALASSAEDTLEFLQILKSGKLIENILYLPPINQWLNLYRNHRQLYKGVSSALRELDSEMSEAVDFYEFLVQCFNEGKKITPEEKKAELEKLSPDEFKELVTSVQKSLREVETRALELFKDDDVATETKLVDEKEEKKKARKFLNKHEVIFYLRVWIPCFLIYGIYPPYLLRKARQGNEDALEKLLRLDKSIIDDPKIREIFHQASIAKKRSKFDLMTKTMQKAPKVRIEIQSVKYALAGLISVVSIALGQRLTAAEISKLFNAIARDSGKGIVDEDIAALETFEKAVQRYRTFWQVIPKADSK